MPPAIAKAVIRSTRNLLCADHSMMRLITCLPRRDAAAGGSDHLAALPYGDRRLPRPGHGDVDLARVLPGALRLQHGLGFHGGHRAHLRHEDAELYFGSFDGLPGGIGDLHAHGVLAHLGGRGARDQVDTKLRPGGRRRHRVRLGAAHGLEGALEAALGVEDEVRRGRDPLALAEALGDDAAAVDFQACLDRAWLEIALALVDKNVLPLTRVHDRVLGYDQAG